MSYHAASGKIIVGLTKLGHVAMWQTDPYIAPHIGLRIHPCIRERLALAQKQANFFEAILEKADEGLRYRMSREQELKHSIADLEAKCAYIAGIWYIN